MLMPAIDCHNEQAVRLVQGKFDQVTTYATAIETLIQNYADAGATWIHLVDLDGARSPQNTQLAFLLPLIRQTNLSLQTGGGIRTEQDIIDRLSAGAQRVVIGSLAIKQPALVSQWINDYGPEHIVLALDVRSGKADRQQLATHGWRDTHDMTIAQLLTQYEEHHCTLRHILCTDISKDGLLSGPNLALYRSLVAQYPHVLWQASGGVSSIADITALLSTGVSSVILGRALLDNHFRYEEAIQCWQNASSRA